MSFKREGNDKSQLNILKKRRVADLLSNFIPEDEAALLSNGRYTCLVCHYRPVFDTVDMLTVHRKGKRHLEGLKAFYGKQARLKHEITKRKQENLIRAEDQPQEGPSSEAPLLAQTRKLTHHALLKTTPYNSCHRRTSSKTEKRPASSQLEHVAPPCGAAESADVPSMLGSEPSKSSSTTGGHPPSATPTSEPMSAQRRLELEHYVKLKSDGWLQDRCGRWVKDEGVEFDSDEDEPPSLATVPSLQP